VKAVQLHGPQFPPLDGAIAGFTLIRAIAVSDGFRPEDLRDIHGDAYLLDTFDPALRGGTGRGFTWSLARNAHRFGTIVLAGGLTSENVAQAIREVRPFAVDVASGVESSPGKKDAGKMRAFFAAVAEADKTTRQ
jgi:phosphoribosylanthranilate isomerase